MPINPEFSVPSPCCQLGDAAQGLKVGTVSSAPCHPLPRAPGVSGGVPGLGTHPMAPGCSVLASLC